MSRRTREFAIRMALGAQSAEVLRMAMRVADGDARRIEDDAARQRGWLLAALLCGVHPHDLVTFVSSAALLAVVALIACAIAARGACGPCGGAASGITAPGRWPAEPQFVVSQ